MITEFELGARAPAWSPDGGSILVLATEWHGEWAGLDEDERSRKPRRITGFDVRLDDQGWRHDRRTYTYLVDPRGETPPRRVGSSDEDESEPAWSPDGARVAMVTSRHNPRSLERGAEVVEVEVDGGRETLRARRSGYFSVDYDPAGNLYGIGDPFAGLPLRLFPVATRRAPHRHHRTSRPESQRPPGIRRPGEADLAGGVVSSPGYRTAGELP